jgi:hypothetical protein
MCAKMLLVVLEGFHQGHLACAAMGPAPSRPLRSMSNKELGVNESRDGMRSFYGQQAAVELR